MGEGHGASTGPLRYQGKTTKRAGKRGQIWPNTMRIEFQWWQMLMYCCNLLLYIIVPFPFYH